MSKKYTQEYQQEKLNFEQAKNMTIEEAVRKEAELKAGITENDNILDKYIKQNREEVASKKFENTRELSELSREKIDEFIAEQRKNLSHSDDFNQESQMSSKELIKVAVETPDAKPVSTIEPFDMVERDQSEEDHKTGLGGIEPAQPFYKKKSLWLGTAIALILGVAAIGYGMLQGNQSKEASEKVTQTKVTTETTTDASEQTNKKLEAFNKQYATFFKDEAQSKLKNSEFGKVSELERLLKALEGTTYYDDAKSKFERLNKSIKAVQAVNDKFDSPAIVDGEKVASSLKSDATLNDLSATVLNTGNAHLDTLLQSVVAEARTKTTNPENSAAANAPARDSEPVVVEPSQPVPSQSVAAPTQPVSATSIYGITNYDVNTLQRQLSRVPYNFDVIADKDNPAWTFNEGILEKIVATAQERGYIVGNNYILEKVNIINGNGYYNMFKPDGTYLFSINCKTGYFVGNAKGNADALDY
ncbi:cell division site-positioning protein MapZ family protein [Streptococcus sp. S784/96/1]|uniref:cell division site-positioning protein MapZ family protein n=1 Tax=Streptococcus sp. S784/96/1 TaxID=2653499 RepID=UPI001386C38F|nr:cell division site-positioning protein MapZ family protein [Streptococcus sp. S784/96/1]